MSKLGLCLLVVVFGLYFKTMFAKPEPFEFSDVQCTVLNTNYIEFTKCQLNRNKENKNSLDVHAKLKVKKVDRITVNAKLFRKVNNKFVPFLYDNLIDLCDFLDNPKRHIFWNLVYRSLAKYSNINHSCPFEHDLVIEKLSIEGITQKIAPIPRGYYMAQFLNGCNKVNIMKVQVFVKKN